MFSLADLPDSLPIFPLAGAIVLPRARLPLHIFEPRYLAMVEDALKTSQRLIGLTQPVGTGDDTRLHEIGCAGRITSFTETEDGRYMVTLTGVARFRLGKELSGFTPYRRADVEWGEFTHDLHRNEHDEAFDRTRFLPVLRRYLETQELSTDWESLKDAEDEMLINALSMLCPFDPEDKQALLEAQTLTARRKTLVTLIEFSLLGGTSDEVMQ